MLMVIVIRFFRIISAALKVFVSEKTFLFLSKVCSFNQWVMILWCNSEFFGCDWMNQMRLSSRNQRC
ncbi:hypothetical protein Bca4012_084361 [Brassica carinata]